VLQGALYLPATWEKLRPLRYCAPDLWGRLYNRLCPPESSGNMLPSNALMPAPSVALSAFRRRRPGAVVSSGCASRWGARVEVGAPPSHGYAHGRVPAVPFSAIGVFLVLVLSFVGALLHVRTLVHAWHVPTSANRGYAPASRVDSCLRPLRPATAKGNLRPRCLTRAYRGGASSTR
jgi:hypothetical protein